MTEPDEESVREALEHDAPLPPDPEAPVADALEQRQTADPRKRTRPAPELPSEADLGDVAEQRLEVDYETDEEVLRG